MNHTRRSRTAHPSVVGDDVLPEVRVVDVGAVPMTDEQHANAVHALAVLIENWRATRTPGAE